MLAPQRGQLRITFGETMPRRPRIKLAGMPQHIVQRGINREPCFFAALIL